MSIKTRTCPSPSRTSPGFGRKGSTVADATLAIHNRAVLPQRPGQRPLDAVSNVLKIANPNIQYQFVDYEARPGDRLRLPGLGLRGHRR